MRNSIRLSYTLASVVCLLLMITVVLANIYPVGYWDISMLYEEEGFAGYGYHSLAEVVGNGFFWEAEDVPVENTLYRGNGPYYAMGLWWISLLYIPIFLGIIYLGWLIVGGRERMKAAFPFRS